MKAELQRIAQAEQVSVSSVGAAFLEKAIQQDIHTQHGALLDTLIDKAIGKHMRSYSTRLALLLVRVAFDAGQTRSLVTNILNRQPGMTAETFQHILDSSSQTAKRNITQRTPQLKTILAEIEQLFTNSGEEGNRYG